MNIKTQNYSIGSTISMILIVGVSIGIGFGLSRMNPLAQDDVEAKKKAQWEEMSKKVIPVSVEKVTARKINSPMRYVGHVEPIEDVTLTAQVSGYIKQVAFLEGSMVKQGDLLFQIDDETYAAVAAQRNAELVKAKAEADRATRYDARMQKVDKRSVTQSEIDAAHAEMLQANAAVTQAEANLLRANIDLKHTRIIAPISGRIGAAQAKLGDYVSSTSGQLARLLQIDPIRVVFSVSDKHYLHGIEDHMLNQLRFRLQLANGEIYSDLGRSDFIDNEMSAETASLPVRIRFDNAKQMLLANAYVTVLIDKANPLDVPSVPQSAIMNNASGAFVYVINEDMRVKLTPVTLGATEDSFVQVSGIEIGTQVVTQGVAQVNPMNKVAIVTPTTKAQ